MLRILIYPIGLGFLQYVRRALRESFVLVASLPSSSRFLLASIIASRHASSAIPSSTLITVLRIDFPMHFDGYYSSSLSRWLSCIHLHSPRRGGRNGITLTPSTGSSNSRVPHLSFLGHILIDCPSIYCA